MPIPLLSSLADGLFGVIDKLVPDADLKARLKLETTETLSRLNLAQMEVNAREATSGSLFVAGWRPFIGWVCGVALAWQYVGVPIGEWMMTLTGMNGELPSVPGDDLFELVTAMLGMAGLRSLEKRMGIARTRLGGK